MIIITNIYVLIPLLLLLLLLLFTKNIKHIHSFIPLLLLLLLLLLLFTNTINIHSLIPLLLLLFVLFVNPKYYFMRQVPIFIYLCTYMCYYYYYYYYYLLPVFMPLISCDQNKIEKFTAIRKVDHNDY